MAKNLIIYYSRKGENYWNGSIKNISKGNTETVAEFIQKGAWIGAGATVLPGISIGKHAIVGAASVVTKDVADYAVVVGNPAKVIKTLDKEKFEED